MTAKLRKLVPGAVAALSAAAVFTVASATIAIASTPRDNGDLIVDATATVENTTFSAELATGDVFTSQFTVVDNLSGGEGDGSEECAVVKSDDEGMVFQCAMILRLPGGDIHISGIYPSDASAPGVGTVIGGSGDYEKVTGAAEITMKDEQTITIKVSKGSEGEEPAEEPAEQPAEEPSEEPAEQPSEDPAEEPAEDPSGEQPVEQPVEQPAEDPAVEQPAEDPAVEQPAVEQPAVPDTPELQDPPVGPIAPEPVAAPDVTTPDSVIAGPNGQ